MITNNTQYSWLYSSKAGTVKLLITAVLGIISGLGLLRYFESLGLVNMVHPEYVKLLLFVTLVSSLIWLALRIFLRPFIVLTLGILYYICALGAWLYNQNEPVAFVDIVIKDGTILAIFVFAGFLITIMSMVDYYLFSPYATKVFGFSFFLFLFAEIVAAVVDITATKTQAFLAALVSPFIIVSVWLLLIELLTLITIEFFGKVRQSE